MSSDGHRVSSKFEGFGKVRMNSVDLSTIHYVMAQESYVFDQITLDRSLTIETTLSRTDKREYHDVDYFLKNFICSSYDTNMTKVRNI